MPTSPTLDNEVSFISGVAPDGTLQLNSFASWNGDNPATYTGGFTNAYKWGADTAGTPGGTVDYYFNPASNWTPTEEQVFIAGLALWSDIANITFVQTTNPAQAQLTFTRGSDGSADTQPNYTQTGNEGQTGGTQLDPLQSAVVSIDTSVPGFGPITGNFDSYGGYVYSTIVHEEGHVMGLGHAGPYNGNVAPSSQQFSAYDNRQYSIMSYISPSDSSAKYYSQNPVSGTNWGVNAQGYSRVPTTWMQADILAVQRLYGLPTSSPLSGGQTFGFNSNVAGPSGIFFDFTKNTSPVITIWDEGVGNILDLSGFSTASNINLTAGTFSSCDGMTNNICIAQGTVIDHLVEGNGANTVLANNDGDFIVGGTGNDTITGGTGNDTITGGLGNNIINGGGGINTLRVLGNSASYTITHNLNGTVTVQGAGETDTLTNIQYAAFTDQTVNLANTVIVDNTTLNFTSSQTVTSDITGTGSVTVSNGAIVALQGNNTYSGGTTVTSGGLWIGGAGGFGNATTTGSLTGNISLPTLEFPAGSGVAYLGFGRSDAYTFSGNISGVGHVEVEGGGTLTLTGDNSAHTGYLELGNNSVLQVASDTNLGGGAIWMGTGTVRFLAAYTSNLNYVLTRAAFDTNGHNITLTGALTTDPSANTVAYGGIVKAGTGVLTLAGADSFTGLSYINAGTLALSGTSGLSSSAELTDSAILDISQITGSNTAIGSLSGSGAVSLGSKTLTIANGGGATLDANSNPSGVFSGVIQDGGIAGGTGGSLALSGGTEYLTGANTYTGITTIGSNGELVIGNNTATGSLGSGAVTDNGILAFNLSANATVSNVISGSGNLEQIGLGTLTLASTNNYSKTYIEQGALAISGDSNFGAGPVALDGGSLRFLASITSAQTYQLVGGAFDTNGKSVTLTGPISTASGVNTTANGGLKKIGVGTLTLAGTDTFTGISYINAGTLALSGSASLVTSADVIDSASLDVSQTTGTAVQSLGGGGTVNLGSQGLTIDNGGGTTPDNSGNPYSSGIPYGVFSGVIQDGGIAGGTGGSFALTGGTEYLTGANTYTGATTIGSNARLVIGNNTATGSLGSGAVTDNGTLVYMRTGTVTVANVISGSGGLTQSGSGNLILTAAETYNGATSVTSGTLTVNGSIASSAVTVASGATLAASSAIGATVIQSGGKLVSDNSAGALDVNGNLTLASGSFYDENFSSSGSAATLVSGTANISGNLVENFSTGTYWVGQTYVVLTATGGVSGAFSNVAVTGLPTGETAVATYDAHDVYLTIQNTANTGTTDSNNDLLWQNASGSAALSHATPAGGNTVSNSLTKGWNDFNGDGDGDVLWQGSSGQPAIWFMNGPTVTNGPLIGSNPGPTWHVEGDGDFNGDGDSDIVLQNDSGQAAIWFMNGATVANATLVGSNPGPAWHIVGTGDFNGDGDSDILWQNDSGQIAMWFMNGATDTNGPLVGGSPGPGWRVAGTGDFNGDGKSDILWQSDTGQAAIWFMNGSTIASASLIGANPGTSWRIMGTGDFNGDGKSDILWQSNTGQAAIWFMNGSTVTDGPLIGSNPGPSWRIMGTADLNGDGDSDILWQNVNGQAAVWFMNGATDTNGPLIGSNPGPAWQIANNGPLPVSTVRQSDFDGDGKSDIVWQSSSGQAAIWFMNGSTVTNGPLIGSNPGPTWHIMGTGDFNGDGDADLVWQNDSGQAAMWLMKGANIIDGPLIGSNPGPTWHIKGTGDFNSDGDSDIVWQSDSGQAAIWFMKGSAVTDGPLIGSNPGPSWHIMGTGDFDGDGISDILWQSDSGQAAIWFMNGSKVTNGPLIGSNPGPAWQIKGTGDFNGDGKSDILWQNVNTGQVAIWLMNGSTVTNGPIIGNSPGAGWTVTGAADINGDGNSDIIWQNANGQAGAWLMSGTTVTATVNIGANPGTSWHIIAQAG